MITKEQLIEFGMKELSQEEGGFYFPMKKVISVPNEENEDNDEFGDISICVSMAYNSSKIVLSLPDGSVINVFVETIEELKAFEKCIAGWEPNY